MRNLISTPLLLFLCLPVFAAELEAIKVRIPEAPPVAPVMAGYMTLVNHSNTDVTITALQSSLFKSVELHSMSMKDGMMHMEQLNSFTIPAKAQRLLEPGGFHLMLINPKKPIPAGTAIDITFNYQDKTSQRFSFTVEK